jgi:hypothetical protein
MNEQQDIISFEQQITELLYDKDLTVTLDILIKVVKIQFGMIKSIDDYVVCLENKILVF